MDAYGINQTGQQTLTVSTTAVSLTLPTGVGAKPKHALIYVGNANVRWIAEGTTPTSTLGMPVAAGSYISWLEPGFNYYGMISRVQFIRDDATDATLEIFYFD